MRQIPVFAAEREAGLVEAILSSASLSYAAVAELTPAFELTEQAKARLVRGSTVLSSYGFCPQCGLPGTQRERRLNGNDKCEAGHTYPSKSAVNEPSQGAKASINDFDLHYLKTLLASTGWNLNEDVFDQQETWAARHTPEDKPFNYEHKCSDIIGHITDNHVVDADGKVLAEDSVIDELPSKFHVITNAVLYRRWSDKALQERMDTIIAEIGEGKWYVSMEALFRGFDYAIKRADGSHDVVARSDKTAYLTKHLRAYGGTGTYNGMKVGRLMRNITFSGKGLVRKPANPESIIYPDSEPFVATAQILSEDFSQPQTEAGYETVTADSSQPTKDAKNMADNELFQKQIVDLKAELEKAQAQLRDSDVKQVTAAKEKAESELKIANDKLAKAATDLAAAVAEAKDFQDKLAESEKNLKSTSDELVTIKAEKTKNDRVSIVVEKLKTSKEDAENLVAKFVGQTDEAFAASIDAMVTVVAKHTPAPLPPKATSADAPMAGEPTVKATIPVPGKAQPPVAPTNIKASETETAVTAALDSAKPDHEPALASENTDDGVEAVRAAIADYIGSFEEQPQRNSKAAK